MNDGIELNDWQEESQQWLERLVDGELTEEAQRQLLLCMDAQPDAWRRCALAFVEAQALRRDLHGAVRESNAVTDGSDSSAVSRPASPKFLLYRFQWMAMAASLIAAFVVGSISRKLWFPAAAENDPHKMVAMATGIDEQGTIANGGAQERQAYKVSLQMPDGQTVDVPVEQATDKDLQSLLADQKPLLSEVERQALESTGHQIEQRREVYPMRLNDGQQLLVPVDFVRIQDARWQ
jgi:hypothetical protein